MLSYSNHTSISVSFQLLFNSYFQKTIIMRCCRSEHIFALFQLFLTTSTVQLPNKNIKEFLSERNFNLEINKWPQRESTTRQK